MQAAYPCGILVHNVSFIGIARSTLDTHHLLRMADVAMYAARKRRIRECSDSIFRIWRRQRDELRREQIKRRIDSLTEREREVMGVLMEGN